MHKLDDKALLLLCVNIQNVCVMFMGCQRKLINCYLILVPFYKARTTVDHHKTGKQIKTVWIELSEASWIDIVASSLWQQSSCNNLQVASYKSFSLVTLNILYARDLEDQ